MITEAEGYDPQCYVLAKHVLQDDPCRTDPDLYAACCHDLAVVIQQAIEGWLFINDDIVQTLERSAK